MNFFDPNPGVEVEDREYQRLLGLPRNYQWTARTLQLAERARHWYSQHGRPWIFARRADSVEIADSAVIVDGVALKGPTLRQRLLLANAGGAVLVAVCAGPEAEQEAQRLWAEERPDEYFFLEVYASAVVEHLTTQAGARLCALAESSGLAVLPHYSPGYPGWSLEDQVPVVELIRRQGWPSGCKLDAMSSGQLIPKKSLVGVFGLAPKSERLRNFTDLIPCEACAFTPCDFRRAPFRASAFNLCEVPSPPSEPEPSKEAPQPAASEPPAPAYDVNAKALRRWAAERLRLETAPEGGFVAKFRYDGSTCNSMGIPLAFDFTVWIAPRTRGYRILKTSCEPAPGDTAHVAECGFARDPEGHGAQIAEPPPVLGLSLDEALRWKPEVLQSGCLCSETDRNHKWRLVLQTLHYRLNHDEQAA